MDTVQQAPPKGTTGKLIAALIAFVCVILGEVAGYIYSILVHVNEDILVTLGGGLAGVGLFIALGGKDYLKPSLKAVKETFRYLWGILVISAVLMIWELAGNISEGTPFSPNWLGLSFESLVLCLCIGLMEEAQFRGLLYGGFLAKGGGKRGSFMVVTLVTAVLFGAAHISWGEVSWSDPLSVAQVFLKIAQTGMYSVMLSAVMLKTHNIVGPMLFHAIDDFMLFVVSAGLYGGGFETEYVTTSSTEEQWFAIVFYLIICALYAPTFYKSIRTLRHDIALPEWGPFVKVGAAAPVPAGDGPGTALPYGAEPWSSGPVAPTGQVPAPYGQANAYGQGSAYGTAGVYGNEGLYAGAGAYGTAGAYDRMEAYSTAGAASSAGAYGSTGGYGNEELRAGAGVYDSVGTFGQVAAHGRGEPYGQSMTHAQVGLDGQAEPYGQPAAYGQPATYGQPGPDGRQAAYGQPEALGWSGAYDQPGAYGQPGAFSQPGASGQPASYAQEAAPYGPMPGGYVQQAVPGTAYGQQVQAASWHVPGSLTADGAVPASTSIPPAQPFPPQGYAGFAGGASPQGGSDSVWAQATTDAWTPSASPSAPWETQRFPTDGPVPPTGHDL